MKIEQLNDDGTGVAFARRPGNAWKKFTKEGQFWVSRPALYPNDLLAGDWEQSPIKATHNNCCCSECQAAAQTGKAKEDGR